MDYIFRKCVVQPNKTMPIFVQRFLPDFRYILLLTNYLHYFNLFSLLVFQLLLESFVVAKYLARNPFWRNLAGIQILHFIAFLNMLKSCWDFLTFVAEASVVIVFEEPLLKLANMNFLERKFSKKVNSRFLRYDAVFIFSMEFVKNSLHKR